jgi:hypothetical protein
MKHIGAAGSTEVESAPRRLRKRNRFNPSSCSLSQCLALRLTVVRHCLHYLLYKEIPNDSSFSPETFKDKLQAFPFLPYAATQWSYHTSRSEGSIDELLHLVKRIFAPWTSPFALFADVFEILSSIISKQCSQKILHWFNASAWSLGRWRCTTVQSTVVPNHTVKCADLVCTWLLD